MGIHFDTRELAEAHLKTHGFVFSRKRWAVGRVRASIHPIHGASVVMVRFWEVR